MPPDGGLLCGLGVADLRADPWLFYMLITIGLSKSEIIDRLGLPEGGITDEKGAEYWAYNNMNQYFIVLYGKGVHKTLILKLEDNTVTNVRLIEKGGSFGFMAGGM